MRKLGCVGSIIAALLVSAGTARADPFTVNANTPSARGIDNAWFNNLVKLNGPVNGTTKTYLADSIIIFGGEVVVAPSATLTLTSHGIVQTGFDENLLLSGAVNTFSLSQPTTAAKPAAAHVSNAAGPSTSVPGANAAYDPLTPSYPSLGMTAASTATDSDGDHDPVVSNGMTAFLIIPGLAGLAADPPSTVSSSASFAATPGTALALANGAPGLVSAAATSLPATPEPSPLFLVAGGLALALMVQRYNLRMKRG